MDYYHTRYLEMKLKYMALKDVMNGGMKRPLQHPAQQSTPARPTIKILKPDYRSVRNQAPHVEASYPLEPLDINQSRNTLSSYTKDNEEFILKLSTDLIESEQLKEIEQYRIQDELANNSCNGIVPILDYGYYGRQVYAVMPKMSTDLFALLEKPSTTPTPEQLCTICYQVVSTLACIAKHGYLYFDLKFENVLVHNNQSIYLSDFEYLLPFKNNDENAKIMNEQHDNKTNNSTATINQKYQEQFETIYYTIDSKIFLPPSSLPVSECSVLWSCCIFVLLIFDPNRNTTIQHLQTLNDPIKIKDHLLQESNLKTNMLNTTKYNPTLQYIKNNLSNMSKLVSTMESRANPTINPTIESFANALKECQDSRQ